MEASIITVSVLAFIVEAQLSSTPVWLQNTCLQTLEMGESDFLQTHLDFPTPADEWYKLLDC